MTLAPLLLGLGTPPSTAGGSGDMTKAVYDIDADDAVDIGAGGTGAKTATTARSNLSAAQSGANSDITSLAGLSTPLPVGEGGTGGATAAAARNNLGSTVVGDAVYVAASTAAARIAIGAVIGTNVQAWDADLDAIAALSSASDKLPYATGAQAWALTPFTAAGRALVDDADATAQRTTLGLAIGTNVQAWDADLDAIAALSSAANKLPYATGAQAWALTDLSAFIRTLLDDADAATARATLAVETILESIFGDGSDGALHVTSGTTTLTASKQYSSIIVDAGTVLDSRAFKVLCSGTGTINGSWTCNGNNGSDASGATGGGVGSAVSSSDVGGTNVGTAGASGGIGAGAQATASTGESNSWSGATGGSGGASGLGSSGAGVTSRGAGTTTQRGLQQFYFGTPLTGATTLKGGTPGTGGGSGGGDGSGSGGGGGGGGHGGGVLYGCVRDLVVGATGLIQSKGGNGGNGGNGGGTNCGGGGTGGGGGAGTVMLAYETISVTAGGAINALPGTAGATVGQKTGTGVAGSLGSDGGTGKVIRYNTKTGAYSNSAV